MNAKQLMSPRVCTCSPDDSLEQAAYIMWDWEVGCLIVTDPEQRPIGMITDRDIAMAACLFGTRLRHTPVAEVMRSHAATCSAASSRSELEQCMRTAQQRRVAVVDADGKLVGIVSRTDLERCA
ncbi:MAG: CBS domain-containing protein [Myxococcota bacterium]